MTSGCYLLEKKGGKTYLLNTRLLVLIFLISQNSD